MREYRMTGRRRGRITAAFLAVSLLCAGCGGKQSADIPELIEPVSVNAAYRPVEYGPVGKIEVLSGTVVPENYCHYYGANVTISDILVEAGDTVETGDILAYADVASTQETLEDYRRQLDYENASFEFNQEISRINQEKLAYLKAQAQQPAEDTQQSGTEQTDEGAEDAVPADTDDYVIDYDKQIATEQENAYYDSLPHEYRVADLQEVITELEEILADGTLKAKHSGQVTYIKDMSRGLTAGANENIVIVSDLSDVHIELMQTSIDSFKYRNYEAQYMMLDGKKVPVKEQEYSTDEKILAEVNGVYPAVRYECPEGYTWELGATHPVYFMKEDRQDVLVVGNDSIYMEGEEVCYVYVLNEEGEQEKRYIEAGVSDDSYTQVLEGLTEGEQVYYQSSVRMPSDYVEYTVELSDFSLRKRCAKYKMSNANVFPCLSESEGEIVEVAVTEDQEVSEGDLLYVIDTGEGKAAMTEAQRSIDMENLFYEATIASYDEQIADANAMAAIDGSVSYDVQILNIQKKLAVMSHESTLRSLQKNYDEISEGNDGNGKVSIYAPVSGTVSDLDVYEGDTIEAGYQTMQIITRSTDIIQVEMEPTDDIVADIGEKVTIRQDTVYWEGTCVGWAAGKSTDGRGYVYTDEQDNVHLSYNSSGMENSAAFYLRMTDDAFLEGQTEGEGKDVEFTTVSMHNVVVLPSSMIHSESDPMMPNKVYHYVWRIVDGGLIKQYILVDDTLKVAEKQVVLSGIEPGDVLAQE